MHAYRTAKMKRSLKKCCILEGERERGDVVDFCTKVLLVHTLVDSFGLLLITF